MNKRGLFGLLIVVVVIIVVGFFWFVGQQDSEDDLEVVTCAPASCCHATECVWESEAQNCTDTSCTFDCRPGTMDCGQGHCEIIDGECGVVWDE